MSHKPYKGCEPKWVDTPAPQDSYRSIFRWGDPEFFKYPKESLYKMMKEVFKLTDDDFKEYSDDIGFDKVELPNNPVQLAQEHLDALREIVGEEGFSVSDYDRLSVAYGFTAYDILRLRHKIIDSVPDVVLTPTPRSRWKRSSHMRPSIPFLCTSTAAAAPSREASSL